MLLPVAVLVDLDVNGACNPTRLLYNIRLNVNCFPTADHAMLIKVRASSSCSISRISFIGCGPEYGNDSFTGNGSTIEVLLKMVQLDRCAWATPWSLL